MSWPLGFSGDWDALKWAQKCDRIMTIVIDLIFERPRWLWSIEINTDLWENWSCDSVHFYIDAVASDISDMILGISELPWTLELEDNELTVPSVSLLTWFLQDQKRVSGSDLEKWGQFNTTLGTLCGPPVISWTSSSNCRHMHPKF